MIDFTDEELQMIVSALNYVRHPQFIELSERIQKTRWGLQDHTNDKDNA